MRIFMLAALIASAAPAFAADPAPCLRAGSRSDYNARPLSLHEVIARNAIGPDRRAYVVSTTCIHVANDAFVALHSLTQCLAKGDDVAVSTLDGHRESCRVSGVSLATGDYGEPYRR